MSSDHSLLSLVTFLPAAGGLLLFTFRRDNVAAIRVVALLFTIVTAVAAIPLAFGFQPVAGYQFVEEAEWIRIGGHFEADYRVGVDGISLFLVLLTAGMSPFVLASTFGEIEKRVKELAIALLFLETAMIGVFVALDLFLFYIFWEAMLIPMFLLIGVWGGERRRYAAMKFFLYTMAGSFLMLLAILVAYQVGGTFSIEELTERLPGLDRTRQGILFFGFAIGFAIKVPMFPFHTWLPDAHVEAPTAGSVVLAGVLLKMGTYGFLRFAIPFFPWAATEFQGVMMGLASVGIVYGALLALAQTDLKKLIAYSSISHLGFVVLGLFSLTTLGITGGVFQMIAHGLSTGALFLLVGVLYSRHHDRDLRSYGGLAKTAPGYAALFLVILLASVGLPGLVGFVGEFLILNGAFRTGWVWGALGVSGVVLGAWYMLHAYRVIMHGPVAGRSGETEDIRGAEAAYLAPFVLAVIVLGIFPGAMVSRIEPSVERVVRQVEADRHRAPDSVPRVADRGEEALR